MMNMNSRNQLNVHVASPNLFGQPTITLTYLGSGIACTPKSSRLYPGHSACSAASGRVSNLPVRAKLRD